MKGFDRIRGQTLFLFSNILEIRMYSLIAGAFILKWLVLSAVIYSRMFSKKPFGFWNKSSFSTNNGGLDIPARSVG